MMTVQPDQDDQNFNNNRMTCKAHVKLPLDVDRLDDRIDTQMQKKSQDIIVHLDYLEYRINQDIGTPKKWRGGIFSECCTESFKGETCDM